jgi:ketosteroid isomerase-like protein
MSQRNVEIWRASLEGQLTALSTGTNLEETIDGFAEIWHPEIELDASEALVPGLNHVYRGADAVRGFWQEWFSAWESINYEYELLDAGDTVVMLVELTMRGRATGIEMPFGKFAWTSTFQDGLIVHTRLYMNQADALEAAGLSE